MKKGWLLRTVALLVILVFFSEQVSWAWGSGSLFSLFGTKPSEMSGKVLNKVRENKDNFAKLDSLISRKNMKNKLNKKMKKDRVDLKKKQSSGSAKAVSSDTTNIGTEVNSIKSAYLKVQKNGDGYIFGGGTLSSFSSGDDIEYTVDTNGQITGLRKISTGETFIMDKISADEMLFTSDISGSSYLYKDELLVKVTDPSGTVVDYTYDSSDRVSTMTMRCLGKVYERYNYEYIEKYKVKGWGRKEYYTETVVTDIEGNERTYDKDDQITQLKTSTGDIYTYIHKTDSEGRAITEERYSAKVLDDGTCIKYKSSGDMRSVTLPDGRVIDSIYFNEDGSLKSYKYKTKQRDKLRVTFDGDMTIIDVGRFSWGSRGTGLILREGVLAGIRGKYGKYGTGIDADMHLYGSPYKSSRYSSSDLIDLEYISKYFTAGEGEALSFPQVGLLDNNDLDYMLTGSSGREYPLSVNSRVIVHSFFGNYSVRRYRRSSRTVRDDIEYYDINYARRQSFADIKTFSAYLDDNGIELVLENNICSEISSFERIIGMNVLEEKKRRVNGYAKGNKLVYTVYPDGRTVFFDDNGNIGHVIDKDGNLEMEYVYDGNILKNMTMHASRGEVNKLIDEAIAELKDKTDAVREDIEAKVKEAKDGFMAEVNKQRNKFQNARNELEGRRYQKIKHSVNLWFTTIVWYETVETPGINEAIAEVNRKEAEFNKEVNKQLAILDAEKISKLEELQAEEDKIVVEYNTQRENMLNSVRHEELTVVANTQYRDILGRDMSKDESEALIERIKADEEIDGFTIRDELLDSEEYLSNSRFIKTVRENISSFLEKVYTSADSERLIKDELGLANAEDISFDYITMINKWLKTQGNHFGKSAFGTLQKTLADKDIDIPLEEIAAKTILIEIFTGNIDPIKEKDLEISMNAMKLLLRLYGVKHENAALTYEDIQAITDPFMTLINDNHYVEVLSVTDGSVTYWDDSLGIDGEEVTVSKEDFEITWKGYVITDAPVDSDKILEEVQAKQVKGSGFFLIPIIIGIVNIVTGVVTAAVTAISAAITALSGIVAQLALGFAEIITGLTTSIVTMGANLMGALGLGGLFAGFSLPAFSFSGLMSTIGTTALKMGAGYVTSIGLEALGVDPIVTSMISSVVTGGVHGMLEGGGLANLFRSAMEFGAYTGMSIFGQSLDLDPLITKIMAKAGSFLTLTALTDGLDMSKEFMDFSLEISGDTVQYAVELGLNATRLDPVFSNIIGIGVKGVMVNGLRDEMNKPVKDEVTGVYLTYDDEDDPFNNILDPDGRYDFLKEIDLPYEKGVKIGKTLYGKVYDLLPEDRDWLKNAALYDKSWDVAKDVSYFFRSFAFNWDTRGKNLGTNAYLDFTEFEFGAESPWTNANLYISKIGLELQAGLDMKSFLGFEGEIYSNIIGGENKIGPFAFNDIDFYVEYDLAVGLGAKYATYVKNGEVKLGLGFYVGPGASFFISWKPKKK